MTLLKKLGKTAVRLRRTYGLRPEGSALFCFAKFTRYARSVALFSFILIFYLFIGHFLKKVTSKTAMVVLRTTNYSLFDGPSFFRSISGAHVRPASQVSLINVRSLRDQYWYRWGFAPQHPFGMQLETLRVSRLKRCS